VRNITKDFLIFSKYYIMTVSGEENNSNATDSEYDGGESSCNEESSCNSSSFASKEGAYCGKLGEKVYSSHNRTSVDDSSSRPEEDFVSSQSSCDRNDGGTDTALSEGNDEDVKSTSRDTISTDSSITVTESVSPQDLHYYVVIEGKLPSFLCERNRNVSSDDIESTTSSLTVSSCSLSEYVSDEENEDTCDRRETCSQKSCNSIQGTDNCNHSDDCHDNDFEFLLDHPTDPDILDTFTMMDLSSSGSKGTKEGLNETDHLDSTSHASGTHKRRPLDQCCGSENQRQCPELDDKSLTEKRIHPSRPRKLRRLYSMSSTVGGSCHKFLRLLQDNNCDRNKNRMEERSISQKSTTTLSSFSSHEDEETSQISF